MLFLSLTFYLFTPMPIIHQSVSSWIHSPHRDFSSILYTVHNPLTGTFYHKDLGNHPTVRSTTLDLLSVRVMLAEVQVDNMSHKPCLLSTEDLRNGLY